MKLSNFGFGSRGGGASGDISRAGTAPKMPKFTAEKTIADIQISDNGTTVFIGPSATSAKGLFELNSTTQGILLPRLTTTQINAIVVGETENSLLVFDTTIGKFKFYDHLSTSWKIIESSTTGGETLFQVLTNGRNAQGLPIQLNGGGGYLVGTLDGLERVDVKLRATGIMTLETSSGIVNFKGSRDTLQHDISALDGTASSSPVVATWQNKSITVAGLDDIKNSYQFAASDEVTPLIADPSQAAYTDYIAVPITVNSVMINVNTAPTGDKIIVDIKKNGTTIFTTPISIDATENTSLTASVPYVLDGTITFNVGDKIEAFVTQVGSTVAGSGLKIKLL